MKAMIIYTAKAAATPKSNTTTTLISYMMGICIINDLTERSRNIRLRSQRRIPMSVHQLTRVQDMTQTMYTALAVVMKLSLMEIT